MTATEYRDYVSRLDAGAAAGEVPILGSYVFLGVPDSVRVTPDVLFAGMEAAGLPESLRPPAIDGANAFKKATNRERFRVNYPFKTGKAEVTARPVTADSRRVVRHLVRELTLPQKEQLLYAPKVGSLTYWKNRDGDPRLTVEMADGLETVEYNRLKAALEGMRADYECFRTHYDGTAVRTVLRGAMAEVNGILVGASRSGTYFVPRINDFKLMAVRDLFRGLSDKVEFHLTPVIDMPDQRDWLTKAAISETEIKAQNLLDEFAELTVVSAKTAQRAQAELRRLEERGDEYALLLDVSAERMNMSLGRLRTAVKKLWEGVE